MKVVTDQVVARLPNLDKATIAAQVEACYQRLARDSRVTEHLAVLVAHDAIEALRRA